MIGKERAAAIDTEHAFLSAALTYPIREVAEAGMVRALEFGVLLRDALMEVGYQVGMVCSSLARELPVPRLTVSADNAVNGLLGVVDYWNTTPRYYCHSTGMTRTLVGRSETSRVLTPGVQISGGVMELISELSIIQQCCTCYYGGGEYCGIGLVGTGSCNHYVGAEA